MVVVAKAKAHFSCTGSSTLMSLASARGSLACRHTPRDKTRASIAGAEQGRRPSTLLLTSVHSNLLVPQIRCAGL